MPTVKVITQQELADSAGERWKNAYLAKYATPPYSVWYDDDKARIWDELNGICVPGKTDPEQVNRIIGNASWTTMPSCSLCREQAQVMLSIVSHLSKGEDPGGYDLCPRCLLKLNKQVFEQLMAIADKTQSVYPGLLDSLDLGLGHLLTLVAQGKKCSTST